MIYLDFDRLGALEDVRESTLQKLAAAPALMMNNPGQQLNTKQYMGNNDQETGRSILQGGTNSLPFQNLGHVNNTNTAPGSHVNSLSKLFKPAAGNTKAVTSFANNQSRGSAPPVGKLDGAPQPPQVKFASTALRVRPEDLVKVATRKQKLEAFTNLITGTPRKALDVGADALKRTKNWVNKHTTQVKTPEQILAPRTSPILDGATQKPLTRMVETGETVPLTLGQKAKNFFTLGGQKNYWVGPGPDAKFTTTGKPVRTHTPAAPTATEAPFGTFRVDDKGAKIFGQSGAPVLPSGEVASKAPGFLTRLKAARKANAGAGGRVYNTNPIRGSVGRDITRGTEGGLLPWSQRTARPAGWRRAIPTRGSVVGTTGATVAGVGGATLAGTVYNPFYDLGLPYFGDAPGDVQLTEVKKDPNKKSLSLTDRLKKSAYHGLSWAPWSTAPGVIANLASDNEIDPKTGEEIPITGNAFNALFGTKDWGKEIAKKAPGDREYDTVALRPEGTQTLDDAIISGAGKHHRAMREADRLEAIKRKKELERRIKAEQEKPSTAPTMSKVEREATAGRAKPRFSSKDKQVDSQGQTIVTR